MTQEQIERAADLYSANATPTFVDSSFARYATADAFEAGAQWRINSVWHTTADKPDFMRQCLLYLRDPMRKGWHIGRVEKQGTNKGKWNIYGYFTPALHKYVARWAYIEDLLPADSK